MAEIVGQGRINERKFWRHAWSGLANGDTGRPAAVAGVKRITVVVDGTLGSGGEVTMEGSDGGSNWFTLYDDQGNDVVMSAAGASSIASQVDFVRPNVTGGDGTTDLTVTVGGQARD